MPIVMHCQYCNEGIEVPSRRKGLTDHLQTHHKYEHDRQIYCSEIGTKPQCFDMFRCLECEEVFSLDEGGKYREHLAAHYSKSST